MILISISQPASAQYYQQLEPGYMAVPVSEDESLLRNSPHPEVLAAQAVALPRTELSCLLKLEAGSMRQLEMRHYKDVDSRFAELEMRPPDDWVGHDIEFKREGYNSANGQVFIGIGVAFEDDNTWGLGLVSSYLKSSDGSFHEISRHEVGHEYISEVFVLDANMDGRLDVIVSWMTGAGSGGGVDLLSVNSDGSFSYFGDPDDPSDFASQLWSAHGTVELIDYDNDGDWELQLAYPLFFSAAGYYLRDIVSFDAAQNAWAWQPDFAPEYYAAQDRFYERLLREVRKLRSNPAAFRFESDDYRLQYSTVIDGERVSLLPFINPDSGEADENWIEELRIFVEGETNDDLPLGRIIMDSGNQA